MTLHLKRGDLLPALEVTITNADTGVPVNLATATSVRIIGTRNWVALFNDTTPTRDNPAGKVTHTWLAAETAVAGRIAIEVEVTWPGGMVQTFPPAGYLAVDVGPDLG